MNLNTLKLELIQHILATDDPELLEKILEIVSQDSAVLRESQAPYSIKEDEPVDLSTLSPELQESIKRGLADVEAGRVHSHEDEEKYWEQWFKEN